jgi:small GTP-binding protein
MLMGAATGESPVDLVSRLDELIGYAHGLLPESASRSLEDARQRIEQDRFNLAVVGEFKRGKSSLVNALLGREIMPTGVIPLTSVVTMVRAGSPERLVVRYANGREQPQPIDALSEYVTETHNPTNSLGVEAVTVELEHELLRTGLQLIDTPGIGSIHSHNTEAARASLPHQDAAICVLDAGQPLSEQERRLLSELAQRVPRLLIAINKVDHLDPTERGQAVHFIRTSLTNALPGVEIEAFGLSARTRDGVPALAARLLGLAEGERAALLVQSVAALARLAAADAARAARFEAHAIQLPLRELGDRTERFRERIEELRGVGYEAGELLESGVERAVSVCVNRPLIEYAREQTPRMQAALQARAGELGKRSGRELSLELERWIDDTLTREFEELVEQFERTIAETLSELERRYAQRIAQILEQVGAVAADVFGTPVAELVPEVGLRTPSRFTFKLHDVEHALDMLVGFGRTVAPGALGRRLVMRDAEQRLIGMADRHAGRLRSELAARVFEAARQYRADLARTVEEAIASIDSAIARARDDHRSGEEGVSARLAQLDEIAERCDRLAVSFAGSQSARPA